MLSESVHISINRLPRATTAPRLTIERELLTTDVDEDGFAANGMIRIAPSPGKGMGAFAARFLFPYLEIGHYAGEQLSLRELRARYGTHGIIAAEDVDFNRAWRAEQHAHGFSTTGSYVVKVADDCYVDAESPLHSTWTRFINHGREPNLGLYTALVDGHPRVRLVVERNIAPGDELLFDYGSSFFDDEETPLA